MTTDPIFALIEAHRAAVEAANAAPGENPCTTSPELFEAETRAAWAVLDGRPTTLAGALRLARYTASTDRNGNSWPEYRGEERAGITPGVPSWSERVLDTVANTIEAVTKPKPVREGEVISGTGAAVHFAAEVHEHIDHLDDLIQIVGVIARAAEADGDIPTARAILGTFHTLGERHSRLAEDHQALRNIVCGLGGPDANAQHPVRNKIAA